MEVNLKYVHVVNTSFHVQLRVIELVYYIYTLIKLNVYSAYKRLFYNNQ